MNVQIIDIHHPLWLETLQKLRHDVYHLPGYLTLEAKQNHATPEAVLITEGDAILFVPYLLRQCDQLLKQESNLDPVYDVISPYGYPGILVNDIAREQAKFVDSAIHELTEIFFKKNVCSAFFRLHPILDYIVQETQQDQRFTENGETVSIDLTLSESEIWAHTRKGHQSTINKCKRLGLIAKMVSFEDYIGEFMEIYAETMSRVAAKEMYFFGHDYFLDLLQLNKYLHLCVVELEQRIICASLFFECCGIVQAHLGGTKTDYLQYSPFNLLLHHVRLWAKARGNEFLHLGGGVGGSKEDKLYTFKSGFSRQRHRFLTLRLITDPQKYAHLVNLRAKALKIEPETLLQSNFFPAYRAS